MNLSQDTKSNSWENLTLQELKQIKRDHLQVTEPDSFNEPKNVDRSSFQTTLKKHPPSQKTNTKRYRRPVEASSRKPHSAQEAYGLQKKNSLRTKARDPRFSDLSGVLNNQLVSTSYSFINDLRKQEKAILKTIIQKGKKPVDLDLNEWNIASISNDKVKFVKASDGEKAKALEQLNKMESQETLRKHKTKLFELKQQIQQDEKAKIAKGNKLPFFTKKSELRKKMVEIKSQRKQQLFHKRKEQKLATKDKIMGRIPSRKIKDN